MSLSYWSFPCILSFTILCFCGAWIFPCFLHIFITLFFVHLFTVCLHACLFTKEGKKERTWTWVDKEEGRIWEELWKRNLDQNILYWKTFSIKNKTCLKDEKSKNHVMSMVKFSKMTLFFSNRKANFPCRLFEHLFHGLPLNAKPIWFWNSTNWIPQWLPELPCVITYTSWHLAIISERNSYPVRLCTKKTVKKSARVCMYVSHAAKCMCACVC